MPIEDHEGRSPTIAASAWVAPTATIRGDVTLGEQVGVWYSAVIRTEEVPIEIGDGTNIQDGCVVHADPGSHDDRRPGQRRARSDPARLHRR